MLVKENYGDLTLNINPDSIYTGALGGATFAWRAVVEEGKTIEARVMTITIGIDIGSGAVKIHAVPDARAASRSGSRSAASASAAATR